jgi:copper chaperone
MVKLQVTGMSCEHCVRAVEKALKGVPGVESVVEVSLERGEAIVEGQPEVAALVSAIAEEGYTAEPAP